MFSRNIKLITAVSLFALTLIAVVAPKFVAARDYGLAGTRAAADLPASVAGASSPDELAGVIVSAVLSLIGIVFFFIIFYSGFRWMTARGNSTIIDSSKDSILSAAIGLIIVLAAYAITNFIFTELSSTSVSSENPDAACINAGGSCGTQASCTAGTVQIGLCSGGTDNVCCIPN